MIYPRNDLDYASRFLHMMFAWPTEKYEVDPVLARALDKILILYAPLTPALHIPSLMKAQNPWVMYEDRLDYRSWMKCGLLFMQAHGP